MTKPNVDRNELIKIISIIAEDMPKGMEILELHIEGLCMLYAKDLIKEIREDLNINEVIKD